MTRWKLTRRCLSIVHSTSPMLMDYGPIHGLHDAAGISLCIVHNLSKRNLLFLTLSSSSIQSQSMTHEWELVVYLSRLNSTRIHRPHRVPRPLSPAGRRYSRVTCPTLAARAPSRRPTIDGPSFRATRTPGRRRPNTANHH